MSTDVPVHHHTVLHVHRCTWSSLYLFSLFILFLHNKDSDLSTHLWVPTYPQIHPKINVPVYPHASPLPKNKELPVTTTTCVHAHLCTRSWPYLFIFILSFRLTVKIYPSTFPLFYMSTDVPVHQYTCSVYFLFFCISYAMTFQLIYWGTYPQIHPKINLPLYSHASLSSNHKDLPVTTTACVPARICTHSWSYLFILILSFWLTI